MRRTRRRLQQSLVQRIVPAFAFQSEPIYPGGRQFRNLTIDTAQLVVHLLLLSLATRHLCVYVFLFLLRMLLLSTDHNFPPFSSLTRTYRYLTSPLCMRGMTSLTLSIDRF